MTRVYTLLILTVAITGVFGISSKAQLASLSQAKKDFIPEKCIIGGALPQCDEDQYGDFMIQPSNYAACVCFENGTCEFRTDKSRCKWCYYEGAVSVNEGQKCPDLKQGLLHVCPRDPQEDLYPSSPPIATDPLEVDPIYVEEPIVYVPPVYATPPAVEYDNETPLYAVDPLPISETAAKSSKQSLIAKPITRLPPIKIQPTKGCVCTNDGCTKTQFYDWTSQCDGDRVVAVVENGPCPKSAPLKLKAPEDAYKCKKSDRNTAKMCPMYISMYGCVCYKDGHCENRGTNACTGCISPDVVSVSTSSCDCV